MPELPQWPAFDEDEIKTDDTDIAASHVCDLSVED